MKEIKKYLRDNRSILFAYQIDSPYLLKQKRHISYSFDIAFYLYDDENFFTNKMKIINGIRSLPKAGLMWIYCLNTSSLEFQFEILCKGKVLRENKRYRLPFEDEIFKRYIATTSFYSRQTLFKKGDSPLFSR